MPSLHPGVESRACPDILQIPFSDSFGELGCNDRAKRHVALLAKAMMHDISIAADQDAGRRALHAVPPHGDRDRRALGGFVDPDRKVSRYSWMKASSETGVIAA